MASRGLSFCSTNGKCGAGNKMLLIAYRYLLVGAQVGKDWMKLLGDCKNGRVTKVTTDGIFNKSKNELSSSNLKIVLMKLLLAESGITTCLWCPTTSEVLLIQTKKKQNTFLVRLVANQRVWRVTTCCSMLLSFTKIKNSHCRLWTSRLPTVWLAK